MTPEELAEIKAYFANRELPQTLQYNDCTYMTDLRKAINSDIMILERFGAKSTFSAPWERLNNIKKILEEKGI